MRSRAPQDRSALLDRLCEAVAEAGEAFDRLVGEYEL
jgi:hypothetical protein